MSVSVSLCVLPFTMQSSGLEHEDSFDFLFKIILVGDSDVGKTCVVQSFKSGIFIEKQQNTIGVDFTVRTLNIDGRKVKVAEICFVLYFSLCTVHSLFTPAAEVFCLITSRNAYTYIRDHSKLFLLLLLIMKMWKITL